MTTLAEIIGSYTALTPQGKELKGACPLCQSEEKTLFVNGVAWKCFNCDSSGDAIEFISLREGIGADTAAERIASGVFTPTIVTLDAPKRKPRIIIPAPDTAGDPPTVHRLYGAATFTAIRDAEGQRLGYAAQYDGSVTKTWTYGAVEGETPYWAIGAFDRPHPIVGIDRLAQSPTRAVLVCSSLSSMLAAATKMPAYVAVTSPSHWSKANWEPLRERRGLLWPANTQESVAMMQKLAETLAVLGFTAKILDPQGIPVGHDLCDLTEWDSARVTAWATPLVKPYAPVTILSTVPQPSSPDLGIVDGNVIRKPKKKSDDDDDEEKGPLALSDSHLAVVFATQHGDSFRYVPDWSSSDTPCWFVWQENLGWKRDIVQEYWPLVEQICIQAAYTSEGKTLTPDARRKLQGAGKYNSVISCVKRHRDIARPSSIFDTNIMLLGIPGGYVDLETGKAYTADKSQHITLRTSCVPVAGEHPIFDSVMDVISSGDKDTLEYLWKWFGLFCTGDTSPERFLYLHAEEGAGKSLLTRTLSQILGSYADSIPIDALVEQKHARHSQEWAKLQNKRLVTSSEGSGASKLNEALVKRVTGNDAITARFMRGNDLTWFPHFKLLLDGNSIPRLTGESGMNRRLDLVEFAAVPESRRDTTLKTRIVAEYPAILHSMIQACLRYQREGLAKPAAVAETSKAYIDSQDALGAWMDECVKPDSLERVKTSVAYLSYSNYVKRNNGHPFGQALFTQRMKAKGFEIQKSGVNYFLGLTIKADEPVWSGTQAPPYYGQDDE